MPSGDLSPKQIAELAATARGAIEQLAGADHSLLADAGLGDHVVELVELGDRVEAIAGRAAGAWAARGAWAGDGFGSPRAWLTAKARTGSTAAGRTLSLGRFLDAHDRTCDAVLAGEVPVASARAMAMVITEVRQELFARDEELLVTQATKLTVDDFAKVLRRWVALADDELADASAEWAYRMRRLHLSDVGAETKVDGSFERSDGAIARAALEHAMDPPDGKDRPGGQRSLPERRADAFIEICRQYCANANLGVDPDGAPGETAPRATVACRVDLDVLTGSSDDPFDPAWWCDIVGTGPVGRETVRRLLCDSWVSRIVTSGRDLALDLGASARLFTDAQRTALVARDGDTCVVPGCCVPVERCDAHHLEPFEVGGPTDLANGAFLCHFHHHKVHEGRWRLRRDDVGAWHFEPPPLIPTEVTRDIRRRLDPRGHPERSNDQGRAENRR